MLESSLKIILGLGLSLFLGQAIADETKAKMLGKNASRCNMLSGLNYGKIPNDCQSFSATRSISAPPSSRSIKTNSIAFSDAITFEYNSSEILASADKVLNTLIEALQDDMMKDKIIRIEGHTDIVGSARYNKRLSERRAKAIKRYLVDKGINPERLKTEGYGFQYLFDKDHPKDGINRRVEFANLSG